MNGRSLAVPCFFTFHSQPRALRHTTVRHHLNRPVRRADATRCFFTPVGRKSPFRIFGARSASASTRTAQRARSCDRWAAGPGGKSGHQRPLGSHCPPLATASRAFGGPRCGLRYLRHTHTWVRVFRRPRHLAAEGCSLGVLLRAVASGTGTAPLPGLLSKTPLADADAALTYGCSLARLRSQDSSTSRT